MTRPPIGYRRRRGFVTVGPLPGLSAIFPAIAIGGVVGFLLYWSDITLYDAVFHPLRSLRYLAYSFGEILVEAARALPFVIVATGIAVVVGMFFRRRQDTDRVVSPEPAETGERRA